MQTIMSALYIYIIAIMLNSKKSLFMLKRILYLMTFLLMLILQKNEGLTT